MPTVRQVRRAQHPKRSNGVWTALRLFYRDTANGLRRVLAGPVQPALQRVAKRGLEVESLEPRQLLAANPMITEFLARNDGGLRDGDGRTSDWIEIFNAGDEAINLQGYHLTDRATEMTKWTFPSVNLGANEYLVVFASGQESDNYVDPEGNLHTNFTLKRSGEYLALVSPGGAVVSAFGTSDTNFPEQLSNVSYGVAQSLTLLDSTAEASYLVPTNDNLGTTWTLPDFDASANGFTAGTAAIGFEGRPDDRVNFTGEIVTELPDRTHAAFVRIEFDLRDASAIAALTLNLKYDNGFVAYLNGNRVAEENAPAVLNWVSTAPDASRRDNQALEPVEFDLSAHVDKLVDGKNVLAFHVLNNFSDNTDLLLVPQLDAGASDLFAATGREAKLGYMMTSTPGTPNVGSSEVYIGFVEDTKFSVDRGFYYQPFQVEITTATPRAQIRYTTDGKIPTATTGTAYSGPITINGTTALRAAAFVPGFLPTDTDTQTYLFPEQVLQQNDSSVQPFVNWGHAGPDWEMDPDIVNHPDPESRAVVGDLLTLPTLSLVMNWDEMFGDGGIYIQGESVERAVSMEIMHPDGTDGVQTDASIQIVGGSSTGRWKSDKLSMRLKFNREYGDGDLNYPVFDTTDVDSFDTLVVDAHLNNVWHYGGGSDPTRQRRIAQYLRDAYAADMQLAVGGYATHDRFVQVYIDGIYWGMHRLHERPDDNFAASYLGGDNDDYDVMRHGAGRGNVMAGTHENYDALLDAVRKDMTDPANYQAVTEMLDVDDFINYMLINFYGGNNDWAQHNWYASFNRESPDGRWRFHSWDAEKVIENLNDDLTRKNDRGGPTEIHQALKNNPEYALRFADHVQEHLFNDGVLTPDGAAALYQIRLDEINEAVRAESARWGDNQRAQPYTRGDEWVTERDRLLNDYFPQRTDVVIGQLQRTGVYPSVAAPTLSQHGGVVSKSFDISLTAPEGTIYYTTDGSDPRLTGGAVAPGASQFTSSFNLTGNTTINARVLHDGEWSALTSADFLLASEFPLRISEINYNPHEAITTFGDQDVNNDRFEYVELVNTGAAPINLEGVQLVDSTVRGQEQGIRYTFAAQTVQPGQRVVVVRDREAFQSRYGNGITIAAGNDGDGGADGEYAGRLANNGEQLTLVDAGGAVIQQFTYRTRGDWPERANGGGSSLEMIDLAGSVTDANNWRASSEFGGSPGTAGGGPVGSIVINEVLANSKSPDVDAIELRNTTASPIDVSNWYLSDTADNYFKYRIGPASVVAARGYHVLTETQFGFGLDSARGDQLWLLAADANGKPTYFVDHVQFGTSAAGVTMGPWPTAGSPFVQLAEPTLGGPNTGIRNGEVVVTEVYFNPLDPDGDGSLRANDFEFIELYNRTNSALDITGWQLAGATEYEFPAGTLIGPQETLLVVGFDPANAGRRAVFSFTLSANPSATYAGRYSPALDDTAGQIQLLRPEESPADDPSFTPYVLVDEITYGSEAPWPTSTAGTGDALSRTQPTAYGNLIASWRASTPTPGNAEFVARSAGDANEDGRFDQRDIALVLQGGKYGTGQPASWSEGDWNGDGRFDNLDLVAALQTGTYLQGAAAALRPATAGGGTGSAAELLFAELSSDGAVSQPTAENAVVRLRLGRPAQADDLGHHHTSRVVRQDRASEIADVLLRGAASSHVRVVDALFEQS